MNILRFQLRRLEYEVHALGQKVYTTPTVPKTKAQAAEIRERLEAKRREQALQDQKDLETPVEISPQQWEQGWMGK